jgi:hypothetical protein
LVTNTNPDLVLLGAGHSHLQLLAELIKIGKWLREKENRAKQQAGNQDNCKAEGQPVTQVLLIDQKATVWYSGFFSGFLYGEIAQDQMEVDLTKLTSTLNQLIEVLGIEFTFLQAEVLSWNLEKRIVVLSQGESIQSNALSINLGAPQRSLVFRNQKSLVLTNHWKSIPTVDTKPLALLIQTFANLSPCEIVVVGGGASGIELVLGIQAYVNQICPDSSWLFTLEYSKDLLKGWPRKAQSRIRSILSQRGIRLVDSWDDQQRKVQVDPYSIPGLVVNATGFFQPNPLQVDTYLRVVHCSKVYGTGDGISVEGLPPVYGGVYPVRQGPVLLRSLLQDQVLRIKHINPDDLRKSVWSRFPWIRRLHGFPAYVIRPVTATKTVQNPSVLQIINLGTKPYAIGRWNAISMTGWLLKKMKYIIDQKFLDQFTL